LPQQNIYVNFSSCKLFISLALKARLLLNRRWSYFMAQENLNMLEEKKRIIYEIFKEDDSEQTIACIIDVFPRREPLTETLHITPDEFYYFAKIYCKKAVKDGLSIIAKDRDTGGVIGFIISEDLASEPPEGIEMISKKFHPIMALLYRLEEEYKKTRRVNKGEVLHLFMGGVSQRYEGRNISTTLIDENLKLAKMKNFSYAIGEVTGKAVLHITRDKLGFIEKHAIEYESFTYKGVKVFKNIETSTRCILVEKQL
jgi:hypothetical protein